MVHRVLKVWYDHFQKNFFLYLITFAFFSFGIILGALGVKAMDSEAYSKLSNYFNNFLSSLKHWEIKSGSILWQTVFNHLKAIFLIWFLGLTIVGIPIILTIVFIRGFVLGFTVGFLIEEKTLGGLVFAILAVLPSNSLFVPALIVGSVAALSFSLGLVRGRLRHGWGKISQFILAYSLLMMFLAAVSIMTGIMEAYLTPRLLQIMVK